MKKLKPYSSPTLEVVEICPRGFLCDSQDGYDTQMNVRYKEETI